jgi:hypothetical protein
MLPSPRSIKYFEALAREGDDFDYDEWLKRVRLEEAVERGQGALPPAISGKMDNRSQLSQERVGPVAQSIPPLIRSRRWHKSHGGQVLKASQNNLHEPVKKRLLKVCDVWDEILEDRSRESIYRYLKAVYSVVMKYQRQGRDAELLRCAGRIADLPISEKSELFATVIRCTCDQGLDAKAVSKFSRALRYAAHRDRPPRMLVAFIKKLGGINSAANRYARKLGRGGKTK